MRKRAATAKATRARSPRKNNTRSPLFRPNNPRLNDAAVDAVAASLRGFGFRQPIVVDPDDVIIVGHVRYKAALKLGLETVPIHVANELTPEQIKAYRIADNKTAELSDWNYELLPIELAQLQEMN
jgi:ParB-like chromosome segregation protein Spo0J